MAQCPRWVKTSGTDQQFGGSPEGRGVGGRFQASAEVVVDGVRAQTAPLSHEVTARRGLSVTWQVVAAGVVTCDVTSWAPGAFRPHQNKPVRDACSP